MPSSVPHVDELGVTSAPLKSASFFLGEYCKPYNGESGAFGRLLIPAMLRHWRRGATPPCPCADLARSPQRTSCCARRRIGILNTA